jgi:hypothetical protein
VILHFALVKGFYAQQIMLFITSVKTFLTVVYLHENINFYRADRQIQTRTVRPSVTRCVCNAGGELRIARSLCVETCDSSTNVCDLQSEGTPFESWPR